MKTIFTLAASLLLFFGNMTFAAENEPLPETEIPRPSRNARNRGRGEDRSLVAGEMAPEFKLKSPDGEGETALRSLRKNKPVVLMFGSYT